MEDIKQTRPKYNKTDSCMNLQRWQQYTQGLHRSKPDEGPRAERGNGPIPNPEAVFN